jgi:hypothetical protein
MNGEKLKLFPSLNKISCKGILLQCGVIEALKNVKNYRNVIKKTIPVHLAPLLFLTINER